MPSADIEGSTSGSEKDPQHSSTSSQAQAPVRDTFLVFGSPVIGEEEIAEVVDSLKSGWVGTGPKVQRFERMLEEYIGVPHVRCLASCTAALILGMHVMGIGEDDEVIVPSMTFVASANAIEHVGATPVLVDCEPRTGLVDLDAAEAAISERTRAIMPVHLGGRPVDMDRLLALRDKYGLVIIEDAAHALGAKWRGERIGQHGNLAAFSFYVTKNITTIEGGALATEDPDIAGRVERLALHGLSQGAWQRFSDRGFKHYEVVEPGFKYNMTDVQASLGIHQLRRLDGWIERRGRIVSRYDDALAELPLSTTPPPPSVVTDAYHLYRVEVSDEASMSRDELLDYLHHERIGAGVHYNAVHLHPYYRDKYEIDPESLPVATKMSKRTLSLPLSPVLGDSDFNDVVAALTRALKK